MSTNENQSMADKLSIEKENQEFQEAQDRKEIREGNQPLGVEDLEGINETVSGENRSELNEEERQHHEKHGNRKYKLFKNHDSSHDQPTTNSGPGTV